MNIDVICVGNLKEKYWKDATAEYSKRLSKFGKINIYEVKEAVLPKNAGTNDKKTVLETEGKVIQSLIKNNAYCIALDVQGKGLSSEGLAEKLQALALSGKSRICFIIGGSVGLSNEVLKKADMRLSFSAMTFPHQMMRVILLEQVYRAFKINNNETYHK